MSASYTNLAHLKARLKPVFLLSLNDFHLLTAELLLLMVMFFTCLFFGISALLDRRSLYSLCIRVSPCLRKNPGKK